MQPSVPCVASVRVEARAAPARRSRLNPLGDLAAEWSGENAVGQRANILGRLAAGEELRELVRERVALREMRVEDGVNVGSEVDE